MGLRKDLKRRALGLSQKAMESLMADEKRSMQLAAAVGKLQKGKQALERGQEEIFRALNLAGRADFKALGKRFSALKRRLRELNEKIDSLPRK
jgi:polyhydroxyalkanoate synthesis regulator phasin